MAQSKYLAALDAEQRTTLEQKLLTRQTGRCFICDDPIDLMLHKRQLDIDSLMKNVWSTIMSEDHANNHVNAFCNLGSTRYEHVGRTTVA